jgi:hypothetical protein
MAIQKVERETVIQTIEQYPDNEGLPITAETVVQPKESKTSFFNMVVTAFWKMSCGLSFLGFFLPLEPAFRHSKTLSPKEKAEIEAYLRGF